MKVKGDFITSVGNISDIQVIKTRSSWCCSNLDWFLCTDFSVLAYWFVQGIEEIFVVIVNRTHFLVLEKVLKMQGFLSITLIRLYDPFLFLSWHVQMPLMPFFLWCYHRYHPTPHSPPISNKILKFWAHRKTSYLAFCYFS